MGMYWKYKDTLSACVFVFLNLYYLFLEGTFPLQWQLNRSRPVTTIQKTTPTAPSFVWGTCWSTLGRASLIWQIRSSFFFPSFKRQKIWGILTDFSKVYRPTASHLDRAEEFIFLEACLYPSTLFGVIYSSCKPQFEQIKTPPKYIGSQSIFLSFRVEK